jgi:O-antigen/teichoic acid export membrane protein
LENFFLKLNGRKRTFKNFKPSLYFNVTKILIGKTFTAVAAFLLSVSIARNLGKSEFGFFSLSISIMVVTSELIGSEAADNGLVRFASPYIRTKIEKANQIFQLFFKYKIITASAVIIISIVVLNPVLIRFTNEKYLNDAIVYGVIGGAIASLWRYNLSVFQCFERFTSYAIFHTIPNAIKIFFVTILILLNCLYLHAVFLINVISLIIGFLLGYIFIPKFKFTKTETYQDPTKQIYNFTKWIYLTNIILSIYSKIDLFLLAYFVDIKDVGIYSAALTIISFLDLLYASLLAALFPVASRINQNSQKFTYLKKSLSLSALSCLIVSPLFFLFGPIVITIYSAEYIESIILIKVLFIGFLFSLMLNPLILVLYVLNKANIITTIFLFLLLVHITNCIIWIPQYGAMAAAVIVTSLRIIGGILIAFFAMREIFPNDKKLSQ